MKTSIRLQIVKRRVPWRGDSGLGDAVSLFVTKIHNSPRRPFHFRGVPFKSKNGAVEVFIFGEER